MCYGCFDSPATQFAGCFHGSPQTLNHNLGVVSVSKIDSGRMIDLAKKQTDCFTADGDVSPCYTKFSSERQSIINSEYSMERLLWLEQAIAAGRTETWLYFQVAEIAAALGQTEKAQRYLRIAITSGWQTENLTLSHYGDLRNG